VYAFCQAGLARDQVGMTRWHYRIDRVARLTYLAALTKLRLESSWKGRFEPRIERMTRISED
jgi:hypothetical protein